MEHTDAVRTSRGSEQQVDISRGSEQQPTVFVVDDDADFCHLLKRLVESVRLNVETYESAAEFLKHYDPAKPGCLVVDVRMPGMSGLELQERLAAQRIRIPTIVMSAYAEVPIAVQAMKSGAIEFLEKQFSQQALLEKIQHAVNDDLDYRRREDRDAEIAERLKSLSPREREVLKLLIDGKTTKEIARELNIRLTTVDFHKHNVLNKMQVDNVITLVRQITWFSFAHPTAIG
jgi:RNA polymerase sigma factor (sigma-70 family)